MTTFAAIEGLPKAQQLNLTDLGYLEMTPIQEASLPAILKGKDVRAQAKTGSGKTVAFGLGLLQCIDLMQFKTQGLVLCPTRELADQVASELRRLARCFANVKILTLCGGIPFGIQRDSLVHPPQIIVATPGRLIDHLQKQTINLAFIKTLVLDEADRLLEMGFFDAVNTIFEHCPKTKQTLLFSATWSSEISKLSQKMQHEPIAIEINSVHELPEVEQQFFEVERRQKLKILKQLLSLHQPDSCVIFCNTKKDCQAIYESLSADNQSVLALHGDMEQRDREQTLILFSNGSCRVLVATDVAARGLDIKALEMVINYELSFDSQVHIHRIGRTARAGEKGLAITLCAPEEAMRATALEEQLKTKLNWQVLPQSVDILPLEAKMSTLCIDGGKKAKMRAGDILGALTGDIGLLNDEIGKITIQALHAYVAVKRSAVKRAYKSLQQGKIKGKAVKVRLLK